MTHPATHPAASASVDWDLATRTATRLVRPGPAVSRSEAAAAVAALRDLAKVADAHVQEVTRLAPVGPLPPTRVVDRPDWVRANVHGISALLGPLVQKLQDRRESTPSRATTVVGSRITGAQAGAVMAFLASRVLGQYEIFGRPGGELLLVAPNVVEVERTLAVDPSDFRLWVCLHECTHRLQFTAVPWLGDYLKDSVGRLVDALDLDPKVLRERVSIAVRELAQAAKGSHGAGQGILGLIQGERSREIMDEITAVMSLVEGHADYVMDAVGPEVVPSVKQIRAKFTHRREGSGALDRMIRKLLGIDVKMRQYAEGSAFVRRVVDATGMDGFNVVWRSQETLPSYAELRAPADWIERVHGFRPAESA